jgi:hypothetical protein
VGSLLRLGVLAPAPLVPRFAAQARAPPRGAPPPADADAARNAVRARHAGVLGLAAVVGAAPYTMPLWLPEAIATIGLHLNAPEPIG